jgi:hypothetical protein
MSRREDHEVHKDMWWHWTNKKIGISLNIMGMFLVLLKPDSNNTLFILISVHLEYFVMVGLGDRRHSV